MANYHNQQPPVGLSYTPSMPFPIYQTQSQTQTQTRTPNQGPNQDGSASMAYQYNAIPPSPPFSAMGASAPQFPSFWNHFQNGGFPPVPVPPPFLGQNGLPIPPPFPPNLNMNAPPANGAPSLIHPQHNISPIPIMLDRFDGKGRIAEVQEADKEEGELSESDNTSLYKNPNLHHSLQDSSDVKNLANSTVSPTRGPVPATSLRAQGESREWSSLSTMDNLHGRPAVTSQPRHHVPPARDSNKPMGLSSHTNQALDRKQAKDFLVVLHQNKYGLSDILREKIDAGPLVEIWQEAGLPVNSNDIIDQSAVASLKCEKIDVVMREPSPIITPSIPVPPKIPETLIVPAPTIPPRESTPIRSATPVASLTEPPPKPTASNSSARQAEGKGSAAAPTDRSAYIARLMAAKSMKSGSSSKPNPAEPVASVHPVAKQPSSDSVVPLVQPEPPRAQQPTPSELPSKGQETTKSAQSNTKPKDNIQSQILPSAKDDDVAEADRKKKLQNELIRRKMAQLQAAKAARTPPVTSSALPPVTETTRTGTSSPQRSESPLYGEEADSSKAITTRHSTSIPPHPSTPMQSSSTIQMNGGSATGIPGLFMHDGVLRPSHENPKLFNAFVPSAQTGASRRKRPVASDFDEVSVAVSPSAFKRPFGQSKQVHDDEEMIIEVSDDETAASGIDLDAYDESMNGVQTIYALAHKSKASKNTPMLSHPLPKPILQSSTPSLPASGMSTPLTVQMPGSSSSKKNVNLSEHEKQIQDLRRRIAEAEKRKKAKKPQPSHEADAAQLLDEVASHLVDTQKATQKAAPWSSRNDVRHDAELNTTDQELLSKSETTKGAPSPQGSATPPLHQQTSEWRKRRREEIQSGLQQQKFTVARNMARLEQLRREMERLEAENRKQIEDKENLIKELEGLGIDTEGMPHEVLQATMDEIVQQREAAAAASESQAHLADESTEATESSTEGLLDAGDNHLYDNRTTAAFTSTTAANKHLTSPGITQTTAANEDPTISLVEPDIIQAKAISLSEDSTTDADSSMEIDEVDSMDIVTNEDESNPHQEEDVVNESVRDEFFRSGSSVKDDSEDDFYSPGPIEAQAQQGKQEEPVRAHTEQSDEYLRELSPMSQDEGKDDDEVAMAISEHSDYDPFEVPVETFPPGTQQDSDDYEPADELPDVLRSGASSHASDVSTPSSSNSEESDALLIQADDALPEVADDVASGQLGQHSNPMGVRSSTVPKSALPAETTHFKPYDSPLRRFKAFRYHPDFSKNVAGGFRSMTFSHQIDPLIPLCPFEACGGACNDKGCTNQHFRRMELSDDMILVQMGTTNPGRTDQEKQEWTEGLRGILKELRLKNTKDPDVVATAIANYRRTFLKDPTKVLNI